MRCAFFFSFFFTLVQWCPSFACISKINVKLWFIQEEVVLIFYFFLPPPVIMWRNYLMLISHVSTHNCGLYITFILNYALTAATAAQILHPTV